MGVFFPFFFSCLFSHKPSVITDGKNMELFNKKKVSFILKMRADSWLSSAAETLDTNLGGNGSSSYRLGVWLEAALVMAGDSVLVYIVGTNLGQCRDLTEIKHHIPSFFKTAPVQPEMMMMMMMSCSSHHSSPNLNMPRIEGSTPRHRRTNAGYCVNSSL